MGRLTIEKQDKIYEIYQNRLSYEKTAREADVSPKTVKKIVTSRRPEKQKNDSNVIKPSTYTNKLLPGQRKILYKEFEKGTDLAKIVTIHDISPQTVKREYEQYRDLTERYHDLKGNPQLKRVSEEIIDFTSAKNIPSLKKFYEIFVKNGFLTIGEIRELLDASDENARNSQVKSQNEGMLLPAGWTAVKCNKCNMLVMAAQNMDPSGQSILLMAQRSLHIECNGNIVPRGY